MTVHKVTYPLARDMAVTEAPIACSSDDFCPSSSIEVTEEIAKKLSIGDEVTIVQVGKIIEIGSWDGQDYNVRAKLSSAELRSENAFEKMSREDD